MKCFKIVYVALVLLLTACNSSKNVVYLQDMDPLVKLPIEQQYEMTIQTDDLLSIVINSKDPELTTPLNLPMVSHQIGGTASGQQQMLGYLVDKQGNIDFPILGQLHVAGLSRRQLTDMIKERLIKEDLLKDPIVTVQFLNSKVSVMGEVASPGVYSISGDRITLLEMLSMAGDLTIHGRRDRVAVIREQDGKRVILFHDLRSSDIFSSPCYYLQQNDIVYVEPNNAKAAQGSINPTVSIWFSVISLVFTITSLIVTLTR